MLERRSGFPIWSWAGWKIKTRLGWATPVDWAIHTDASQVLLRILPGQTFQADEDIKVRIHLQDEIILTWCEFSEHYDLISRALPVLQLSAWMAPSTSVAGSETAITHIPASLMLKERTVRSTSGNSTLPLGTPFYPRNHPRNYRRILESTWEEIRGVYVIYTSWWLPG